jgi:hypothetical protein
MDDGHPCPDCQWTTYLLTGRPVVFLRCDACKNWFHCNVKVKTPGKSIVGEVTIVDVSINARATKDMVNSLLRCDCMAPQIFLSHIAHCDACRGKSIATHSLRLLPKDTLHRFIERMTKQRYNASKLPAYTLQRRCGAVLAYAERYIHEVATPPQAKRTLAYRQKRLEIRNAKHEE